MADQYLSQIQSQRQVQVLAPQLRQSLELLQVPVLELRTLIQQEMEQNPTLEEKPLEQERIEVEPPAPKSEADEEFDREFDTLAKLDDEWKEYFHQAQGVAPSNQDDAARRQHFFDSLSQPESLQQHLLEQLSLAIPNEQDRQAGEVILGSINEDGYLAATLEDLASTTGYTVEQMQEALLVIQEFDPIGVGARDLRECLKIQLHRLGMGESIAAQVVNSHLDALGAKKFADIARHLKATADQIQEAARVIATLEPKPGRRFASDATSYVLPEVMVQKVAGEYVVVMSNDQIPRLHISAHYRQLMADESTRSDVRSYIRDKIRAGLFLIKSIGQRQQTIYNIAREIIRVQHDFLEHGITHLRPLTMAEVAAVLGIHETTVSRAIANKYMQSPRGVFEMKYFFTPGYKTASGQSVSNKTIKDVIAQLVAEEDATKPLSDDAMVKKLQAQGITVARRTIAKYRDELKILPSHLRKGFAK